MNRLVIRMAIYVCGILILFPHPAAFSQCNMKVDPSPKIPITAPGVRVCCSLGVHSGIDPANLKGHKYGNQATFAPQTVGNFGGEPDGYIYTAGAGLVDIGHVRDNADMVLYVFIQLINAQHTIYTVGKDEAGVPNIPTDTDQLIGLAGTIVFANSWAHELTTWGDTNLLLSRKAQDFSAFSPEDMSSNIIGIQVATQAIKSGGGFSAADFDARIDQILPQIIQSLGPQKIADTNILLTQAVEFSSMGNEDLTHKWWMYDKIAPLNGFVRLLRRNFDGAAWKIPGAPVEETPDWMSTTHFSDFYPLFLYVIGDNMDVDATQVPNTNAYAYKFGFQPLNWTATPAQEFKPDASRAAGSVDPLCLLSVGKPVTHGLYTSVKINVYPELTPDVIWTFEHVTQFLRTSFTAVNPNMDDPVKFVAPATTVPVKK